MCKAQCSTLKSLRVSYYFFLIGLKNSIQIDKGTKNIHAIYSTINFDLNQLLLRQTIYIHTYLYVSIS